MATKPVKWFTNSRGFNILPDFLNRFPGASKELTNDPKRYAGTNSPIAFWRFYDPGAIEVQIKALRDIGANNIRIWPNYYVYKRFAHLPEERNPFYNNLKHLIRTLERYRMYCLWVFFDGLFVYPGPTDNAEYDDIYNWHYSPATGLMLNSNFMHISGAPYISSVCKIVSGSQATMAYEVINESAFNAMASANWINAVSSIKHYDRTPNRRISLGFAIQTPWYNVTGLTPGGIADLASSGMQVYVDSSANLLSIHPYANLHRYRSLYADFALSSAYSLTGVGVYFSEGALDLGANSFRSFFEWCETSSLGWSVFQGFAGKVGKVVYPGVGLLHDDGEVRLSSVVNALTGTAIRAGYTTDRIHIPTYKSNYVDADNSRRSDDFYPPAHHQLSHSITNFVKDNPKYQIGGLDRDIYQELVVNVLQNWSTCTTPLSSVRNNYASENLALSELLAEQNFQYGAIALLGEMAYFHSNGWGCSGSTVSSFFNQFNLSHAQQVDISTSSANLRSSIVLNCATGFSGGAFTPGGCLWGPGCPDGFLIGGGDCWDWNAYTRTFDSVKALTCSAAGIIGLFNC